MIRAADENEAEEDRPFTPPPSSSPPPPPPPTAPASSPLPGLPSPPRILAMVARNLAENPPRPPTTAASPSRPSASKEEDGPLQEGDDGAARRQAEAELRLPVKTRCCIREAPAPTDSTCAAKSLLRLLQHPGPVAEADTGGDVAVQDGDAGLHLSLVDAHQVKRGGTSGARHDLTPTARVVSPSTSASHGGSIASYLSSASHTHTLDADEEEQEAGLALVDGQQEPKAEDHEKELSLENADALETQVLVYQDAIDRKGEVIDDAFAKFHEEEPKAGTFQLRADPSDDQEVVEQQDDAIHPTRDETTCDIAAEDQYIDDTVGEYHDKEPKGAETLQLRAARVDQLSAAGDVQLRAAKNDQEFVEQPEGDLAMENIEESIEIRVIENLEVEIIGKEITGAIFYGKMAIQFPPELDRCVHFIVGTLDTVDYKAFIHVDREFFKKTNVLISERFPEQFDLLKWNGKKGSPPRPLEEGGLGVAYALFSQRRWRSSLALNIPANSGRLP